MPAGRYPGMFSAPRGLSLQPMARITALPGSDHIPSWRLMAVITLSWLISMTMVFSRYSICCSFTIRINVPHIPVLSAPPEMYEGQIHYGYTDSGSRPAPYHAPGSGYSLLLLSLQPGCCQSCRPPPSDYVSLFTYSLHFIDSPPSLIAHA